MKTSTIVVSTVAALSMASVLGIAYAQSGYSTGTNQGASSGATGATGTSGTSGTMNQPDAADTQARLRRAT